MRKTKALLVSICIICVLLTNCSHDNSNPNDATQTLSESETSSQAIESEQSSLTSPESPSDEVLDPNAPEDTEVSVDHILMAIEAAYGENYPANGELPEDLLETQFNLSPAMYVDAKGAQAMISVNNDQVVVVQAVPGKGDEVEAALNQAREEKLADTLQYPANTPKINASKVLRHDDFVAFLLIGIPNDGIEDVQSAEAKEYAEQQVQIAVDAFHSVFK